MCGGKHRGRGLVDSATLTYPDDRFPYREQRYITVGLLSDAVVLIAHTETDETIRIIHARKASKAMAARFFASFRD